MKATEKIRWLLFSIIIISMALGPVGSMTAAAAGSGDNVLAVQAPGQDVPPLEDKIELTSPFPVLREKAGRLFEFQVELNYTGAKGRVFDLSVIANQGSYTDILASFTATDKGIESILLQPNAEFPEVVKVRYNPTLKGQIEPGRYSITFRAASGDISSTIELTAVVTARYELFINTPTGRLNAEITSGKENHIAVLVRNNSSVACEDVRFIANVPQGWGISFTPDVLSSIEPGAVQPSDMIITPAANTIAGDYEISVSALSTETLSEMKLRVTVTTPTIWGWIGVLIVVVVIAGLVTTFILLGRR